MALREKLMHYTHDLDCGVDLKQEAIASIEHIAQYMDEDELLHHSRPLALAYLALTEDDSVPVVHGKWDKNGNCTNCGKHAPFWSMSSCYYKSPYCQNCGAMMDGGANDEV